MLACILSIYFAITSCAKPAEQPKINNLNNISLLMQINNPKMLINGTETDIDSGKNTSPIIDNNRTLVPIRAIIEAFGGSVNWIESSKTTQLNYRGSTIELVTNSKDAYINGTENTLDVPPKIIDGRTMLPIRFIAEGFNLDVAWNEAYSTIAISNNGSSSSIKIPSLWKNKKIAANTPTAASNIKVHFIDVGQGDSAFAELPNGETMLIDAGPDPETASNYIQSLGYSAITYVIASHPDADHITGMPQVLKNFTVKKFYMPKKEHTTKIFEQMLNSIADNGCEAIYAEAGKIITETSDLSVTFAGPVKKYSDNNKISAVVKVKYKNNTFLFTGDADYTSEADMISSGFDLQADVLKIGHHGSASSTSENFLNAVNPKYAVISVGRDNNYNHPTQKVLSLLAEYGVEVYRTDESGTIIISGDGEAYTITLQTEGRPNAPPAGNSSNTAQSTSAAVQQPAATPQPEESIASETAQKNANTPEPEEDIIPQDTSSEIVYITKTGSKYHRSGCQHLKSKIQSTVSEAKSLGLTPCSKCNPPQ